MLVPGRSPDEYLRILRLAEFLMELVPDPEQDFMLSFLGIAQYRMGRVEEALASVSLAREIHHDEGFPPPPDALIAALCHIDLGNLAEAEALISRMGTVIRAVPDSRDPSRAYMLWALRGLLGEAEEKLAAAR